LAKSTLTPPGVFPSHAFSLAAHSLAQRKSGIPLINEFSLISQPSQKEILTLPISLVYTISRLNFEPIPSRASLLFSWIYLNTRCGIFIVTGMEAHGILGFLYSYQGTSYWTYK